MTARGDGPWVNITFDEDNGKVIWDKSPPSPLPSGGLVVDARGLSIPAMYFLTDANDEYHLSFARGSDEWRIRVEGSRFIISEDGEDVFSVGKTKPTVTGSRGGNAALTSLLSALADADIIADNTSA